MRFRDAAAVAAAADDDDVADGRRQSRHADAFDDSESSLHINNMPFFVVTHRAPIESLSLNKSYQNVPIKLVFSARCNIYISRLCYDVSVRLSVRLSVTEVHWRIIANWAHSMGP